MISGWGLAKNSCLDVEKGLCEMQSYGSTRTGFRRVKWGCIGCVGFALVLILTGLIYQTAATASDRRNYTPPGRLIDVNGHMMHINCLGEGKPTVILESGLPRTSIDWSLVQPELAKTVRTCAYDRAGYAWSEPGPLPRTGRQLAEELYVLLDKAGVQGPYVLVGHSFGGFVVRLYADQYPDDVVGMVLVDAIHPGGIVEMTPVQQKERKRSLRVFKILRPAASLGVIRLAGDRYLSMTGETERLLLLPDEKRSALKAAIFNPQFVRTAYAEDLSFVETALQVHSADSLGDVPLIVVTRGLDASTDFEEAQAELLDLSSASTQMTTSESDHYIVYHDPLLIVDAVRQILDQLQPQALSN
jgi:pimeloyl-ACP methyl ester carboxylesterase